MLGEHLDADAWGSAASDSVAPPNELPSRTPNRKNGRIPIAAEITIRPANSSQRNDWAISGTCRDISEKGIGTVLDRPAVVGDFYWVEIESEQLQFQNGICRSIRCQFLREDKFETGFEFLTETAPSFLEVAESDSDLI